MNARQLIALLAGVLVIAGMIAVPPWRVLAVPPFGSGEHFAGYSPLFWPPHHPWTLPVLTNALFWNAEHDYEHDRSALLLQEAIACALTALALLFTRKNHGENIGSAKPATSLLGAVLGGVGALLVGFIGVNSVMAPLLNVVPEGRVLITTLLLLTYLAAIIAGTLLGAHLRVSTTLKLLAGMFAGQMIVAYTVFVVLPDSSPESHRTLLAVWLLATGVGAGAGAIWVQLTGERMASEERKTEN